MMTTGGGGGSGGGGAVSCLAVLERKEGHRKNRVVLVVYR
jgi:hypothetical protein